MKIGRLSNWYLHQTILVWRVFDQVSRQSLVYTLVAPLVCVWNALQNKQRKNGTKANVLRHFSKRFLTESLSQQFCTDSLWLAEDISFDSLSTTQEKNLSPMWLVVLLATVFPLFSRGCLSYSRASNEIGKILGDQPMKLQIGLY